jgi:beta-mannanase
MTQRANHNNTADQNQQTQGRIDSRELHGPQDCRQEKSTPGSEKPTSVAHPGKSQIKSAQRENWNRGQITTRKPKQVQTEREWSAARRTEDRASTETRKIGRQN